MIPLEEQTVELKESLSLWRDIVETCAAFGSAQGGKVYVGVRDDGTIVGVTLGKGSLEDLANKIAQNTAPKIVPAITTHQEQGATVIVLDVPEHASKPVTAFGRPFRRSGRTNQVLSAGEVAELYLASRGMTWDETVRAEATLDDIDAEKVRRFLNRARTERQWEIDPQTAVEPALNQLSLMRNSQVTIAALLLFGKNPQRFFVQATLRCARFKGSSELRFLDMKPLEGDIIGQVEAAMTFIQRNTSMAVTFEGELERKERWEYPLDAVREAVTNAVCHRDYAASANAVVKIFDDRLEVWNPGGLPAGLSVEDLKKPHESKPRNKLIARSFFLIKYIEQFGTGIGRMLNDCREAGVPEPEFESHGDTFRIVFRRIVPLERRFEGLGLNDRQVKLLQQLGRGQPLSRADYQKLTGASERTARRDLEQLMAKKLIVKTGAGKLASYRQAAISKGG